MTRILLIVLLGGLLLAAGCDDQRVLTNQTDRDPDTTPPTSPGTDPVTQTVTLTYRQSQTIEPFGLEITFDTLYGDGRCSPGMMCFWEGMASFRLVVAGPAADSHAVIVSIRGDQIGSDSTYFVATESGVYRLDVRSLLPFIETDTVFSDDAYTVTLAISEYHPTGEAIGEVIQSCLPRPYLRPDLVAVTGAKVAGNDLTLSARYSGGCRNHYFALYWLCRSFKEGHPAEVDLFLSHYDFDDECDARLGDDLTFSLEPVLAEYRQVYGRDAPLRLNIYDNRHGQFKWQESVLYKPPGGDRPKMFPIGLGDYWIYADTAWHLFAFQHQIDTIEVIGQFADRMGRWWVLSGALPGLGDTIMVFGNTVYSRQCCFFDTSGFWSYPTRELIPASDRPVTYSYTLEGDLVYHRTVKRSDSVVSVPAGDFSGTYDYRGHHLCIDDRHLIVAPGVGIIFREDWSGNLHEGVPAFADRQVSWLIGFGRGE